MKHLPAGTDGATRDVVWAYSGSLYTTAFPFNVLWNNVEALCNKILGWTDSPEFRRQTAIQQVLRGYTIVYRLVSSPCTDCPNVVPVTSTQQDIIGDGVEGRQILTVHHLLCKTLRQRLSLVVSQRLKESLSAEPPTLLKVYLTEWKTFITAVNLLKVVFSYLHDPWQKHGLPSGHHILPTEVLALAQWSEIIISQEIAIGLKGQLFDLISRDRLHQLDEELTILVRDFSHSLTMLNESRHTAYSSLIEETYLLHLQRYYRENINKLKADGVLSYIEECLGIFEAEIDRVNRILNKCTMLPMLQRLAEVLIDSELPYIMFCLPSYIREKRGYDLNKTYHLLLRSSTGMSELKEMYEKVVLQEGLEDINRVCEETIRSNGNVYKSVLEGIISVHTYFEEINKCFDGNEILVRAMMSGLEKILTSISFIKSDYVLGKELARLAHTNLKSVQSSEECEKMLKDIVIMFQFIPSKNPFLDSYPKYLSIRLLFDSYSDEYERLAIRKISEVKYSTPDFVNKCEVMLRDVTEQSVSLRELFNSKYGNENSASEEWLFQPTVITSYSWPDARYGVQFPTPRILMPKMNEFEALYAEVYPKRHISFVSRCSHGMVKMTFPQGCHIQSIDLRVGQSHLLLMECLNSQTNWAIESLLQSTGITCNEIFLQSLNAFLSHGIVDLYDSNGQIKFPVRSIIPGQFVRLGLTPVTSKRKLNLFTCDLEEDFQIAVGSANDFVSDPVDASHHVVDQVKDPAIQAILVRVFKANRTLSFPGLMEKVKDESFQGFMPTVKQVKTALDFLISRGFVSRDSAREETFSYIS